MRASKTPTFKITAVTTAILLSTAGSAIAQEVESERFIVHLTEQTTAVHTAFARSQAQADNIKRGLMSDVALQANVEVIQTLPDINAMAVVLTADQKARLLQSSEVASIEVDPKRYLMAESTPYGITMVQAQQLSDNLTGNQKVCIMDTGYTLNHPDLPSTGITGSDGYGANNTGNWYNDGNGHGTHVAGTIAALGGNGEGVIGVNSSGQLGLHIVKVFNDQGRWAYGSDLVAAIGQCQSAGASVTSMSLGGPQSSNAERQAFANSYAQGMLHIAAAGNDANSSLSYPASYDSVVSVAAVDRSGRKASFSQYNSQVEIAAPGVGTNSTWNNGGYKSISGTSMATPHVSGVAALVWSHFPQCSNQQIRDALNATAQDKGAAGRDTSYGFGIVKAKDAYDYLAQSECGGGSGVDNAPVARFSASVNAKQVTFSNASTDDKGISSYSWSFGDGNSSTAENPTHTYAADGSYSVTLEVTDTAGQVNQRSQTVKISTAVGGECEGIASWNASKSYRVGDLVEFNQVKYKATWWSTGASPAVYSNVWSRQGNCKTGDGGGTVNQAPKANFDFSVSGLAVSFTNASTDDVAVTAYNWTFGDGNAANTKTPSHTYQAPGSYEVKLTVSDAQGLNHTLVKTVTVTDGGTPPAGCSGLATWSSTAVYTAGKEVAHSGNRYSAKWWTRGANPADNSSSWAVWKDLGKCQ
ncbi:S8 family serine peptidase [Pseudoalteromonas porphyrae]|uniref:Alkaline serine protease n=1 Tax=Pseudoalteromonas porphyrae TaxID=187330 RepID=A0A0N1MWK0_9GAMM|nr:S8 family serine peptidase [Pseudoalteromonas porphyrae]KPH64532.1 alkaline serine protease [Pseudoalteromonas porphyrae]